MTIERRKERYNEGILLGGKKLSPGLVCQGQHGLLVHWREDRIIKSGGQGVKAVGERVVQSDILGRRMEMCHRGVGYDEAAEDTQRKPPELLAAETIVTLLEIWRYEKKDGDVQ